MTTLLDLYNQAEQDQIDVDWFDLQTATSLSMPLPDGSFGIAINPWKVRTLAEETVIMAHELGHCETGSFYNRWATCDVRQQHENRANKWAIKKLIPKDELDLECSRGNVEPWNLAEHFGVTEDFMREAMCFYSNESFAAAHETCSSYVE